MEIADAATYFDNTEVYDAYTSALSFTGQLDLYDGWARDTVTGGRRSISVAPSVSVPARRAVSIEGHYYLIGESVKDSFQGAALRIHYVLQRVSGLATIKTAVQALSSGGTQAYANRGWKKDLKAELVTSDLYNTVNMYFSTYETVSRGHLLSLDSRLHRVHNVSPAEGGFTIAECSELEADAVQTVSYTAVAAGGYTAATDTYAYSAPASLSVLYEPAFSHYHLRTPAADKVLAGDMIVTVAKSSLTPRVGETFTLKSLSYRVLEVLDDSFSSWEMWSRRV